jgi:pimeloyl-ACP methyl ester carboxylesterase
MNHPIFTDTEMPADEGETMNTDPIRRRFPRRTVLGAAAAVVGTASVIWLVRPDIAPAGAPVPANPGSASGAPGLPPGFRSTFTDRFIDVGGVRLHAVVGGHGRPLLLIHGWPQTWYAWRMLMPALARDFTVVAVDQRGIGLSDKPPDGYDTGSQANDMVKVMGALGHEQFAVVGTDTGMPIGYAMAADHPDKVVRLAVAEAVLAGVTPSPPLIGTSQANDQLWHIPFNRLNGLNEQLVKGREDIYFGAKLAGLPEDAISYYVDVLRRDPNALRGSFGQYRAFDTTIAQNQQRMKHKLTMPVLAIAGEKGIGQGVLDTMELVAANLKTILIPGSGHWVAEQAPDQELAALTAFLAPYRR